MSGPDGVALVNQQYRVAADLAAVRPTDDIELMSRAELLAIPLSELTERLAELPADAEVVASCRGRYCIL